jgi:nucleoside-diphosphate-sugar epimerase
MDKQGTVLILGASGGIGGETARQLCRDGWQVRALKRGLTEPVVRDGIEWVGGDAMDGAQVAAASEGCDVIVHAVNPPGYRNWQGLVLPMLRNTIAAAERSGALIVLPGTVYNYDPETSPVVAEDAPQRPFTRKGAIRVAMEDALQAHARRGGRVLIVRAGDFFGPRAGNNWFAQGLVKPGRAVTGIANPGDPGVGHQWAYLPDVAATIAALLARRDELESFACFHMGGHWDADGSEMVTAVQRVAARHGKAPAIRPLPWWLLALAAPFVTTLRELREMRYLWRQPLRLDNRRLVAFLGAEPHTPLDEAVETTLRGLGCLPSADARPRTTPRPPAAAPSPHPRSASASVLPR